MKRPSFQFYPADWSSNPNLKRCSFAEKGVWLEVMCLMHDQDEYGVLRWPMREIAEAVKCKPADLLALVRKGVLKGDDKQLAEPFIYTPRSGRKDGAPVALINIQPGPVWYSSRMVKDEYVRTLRAELGGNGEAPKVTPKASPKGGIGAAIDEHPSRAQAPRAAPSSSSSSSPSGKEQEINLLSQVPARPSAETPAGQLALVDPVPSPTAKAGPPDCPHMAVLALWAEVLPALPQHLPSQWRGSRADHLRARWRETAVAEKWTDVQQGIEYLRNLFGFVGQSAFLTGKTTSRDPSKRPFVIELEWLVNPTNWAKVHEGKYHQESAA